MATKGDAIQVERSTMAIEGETDGVRLADRAEGVSSNTPERARENAENAGATAVLEKKELGLEEQTGWLVSETGHLQERLSATFGEMEDIGKCNIALRAEMNAAHCSQSKVGVGEAGHFEVEREGAADADILLQASLYKAASATEAAAAATADAAREVKAAVNAVNSGGAGETDSQSNGETRAREVAAVATTQVQVNHLEKEVARLREIAQEMASEIGALAGKERNAWAQRSREWERKAARLAEQLETSAETAIKAQRELVDAKTRWRDLVERRRMLEEEAAAARCREAELREKLEASQAEIVSLRSAAGAIVSSEEEAADRIGDCSRRDNYSGRVSDPNVARTRRQGDKSREQGATRVPDEDEEEEDEEEDIDGDWQASTQPAPRDSRDNRSALLWETVEQGDLWSDVGNRNKSRRGAGVGEHVCLACGAPIPSFRKLLDCRLSLDRARVELAEARGRNSDLEQYIAARSLAGGTMESRGRNEPVVVEATATGGGEDRALAGVTPLLEGDVGARLATEDPFGTECSALLKSESPERRLELEVRRRVSDLEPVDSKQHSHAFETEVGFRGSNHRRKDANGSAGAQIGVGRGINPPNRGEDDPDVRRYNERHTPDRRQRRHLRTASVRADTQRITELKSCETRGKDSADRKDVQTMASASTLRTREVIEREKTRATVFGFEESCQAAVEEAERLQERVSRLRVALRGAQQFGEDAEASRVEADSAASAAGKALAAAMAEASAATASRYEVEEKAVSAEREHRLKVEMLEAEVSRTTAKAIEAREQCTVAQGEVSRLRRTARDSDRRVVVLEKSLSSSTADLLDADAARVRALVGRVRDLAGMRWEGEGGRRGNEFARSGSANGAVDSVSVQHHQEGRGADTPSLLPLCGMSVGSSDGVLFEVATLRTRLAASQAQHMELVRASEEVVARCNQRCEARVRAAVAAGKLVAACLHRRGVVSGRDMAVEAAGRLALVKRCFRALREDALTSSRDRSNRRQRRMKQWIGDSFERAGEEVLVMARRKHVKGQG